MKWQRLPLPIDLQVEKERVIFIMVDKNVKVGYPTLEGKSVYNQQSGAVYLKALRTLSYRLSYSSKMC